MWTDEALRSCVKSQLDFLLSVEFSEVWSCFRQHANIFFRQLQLIAPWESPTIKKDVKSLSNCVIVGILVDAAKIIGKDT